MSMYRPHWIPESQHWSTAPPTSLPGPATPSRSSPSLSGSGQPHPSSTPPKDHDQIPPSAGSTSTASSGSTTKLEANYESLNNHSVDEAKEAVKAESYPDYYGQQQHYGHHSPHNDLSASAFINCNPATTASVRTPSQPPNSRTPQSSSKSSKNRPNAGKHSSELRKC